MQTFLGYKLEKRVVILEPISQYTIKSLLRSTIYRQDDEHWLHEPSAINIKTLFLPELLINSKIYLPILLVDNSRSTTITNKKQKDNQQFYNENYNISGYSDKKKTHIKSFSCTRNTEIFQFFFSFWQTRTSRVNEFNQDIK